MCFFIGKGDNNELFSKCASQSKKESADDKDKYQNFETMSLIIHLYHSADAPLYVRLEKVFDELPDFKRFQGVIGLDITVTEDMDLEWQNAIMLLNQLYSAILGCNGIKIVLNARTGSSQTIHNFSCIPKNIVCATSFLGCRHLKNNTDFGFISKMLYLMPSKLMIYGKHDRIAENQLDTMGINYRVYPDFHRISKGVA